MPATIPGADPNQLLFETRLIEEAEESYAGPTRDGQRLGSRVSFGMPAIHDLAALFTDGGKQLPYDFKTQLAKYEFQLVRLVCTLHVAPRSEVSWIEIHVALAEDGAAPPRGIATGDPADPPLVYDLYPMAVTDKVQVEHSTKIAPTLKFKEVQASIGEDALTLRYERLEPRITAFGKGEPTSYWRFTPGLNNHVPAGIKEMDMIVRKRRGTRVCATVRIQGRGRRWGIFPDPVSDNDQQFHL
jgi:hypothetical protein